MKNSSSSAHVRHKTLNLIISRRGRQRNVPKFKTHVQSARLFFLITPIVLRHSRCHRRCLSSLLLNPSVNYKMLALSLVYKFLESVFISHRQIKDFFFDLGKPNFLHRAVSPGSYNDSSPLFSNAKNNFISFPSNFSLTFDDISSKFADCSTSSETQGQSVGDRRNGAKMIAVLILTIIPRLSQTI